MQHPSSTYNVIAFGAKADEKSKDTQAIQNAIETCHRNGGGTVYFPPGTYISGSLHLKSDVALFLDHGAVIKASTDNDDFDPYEKLDFPNDADHETSFFHYSLIWGENVERVAILGTGIIDGNRTKRGGPKPIALKRCQQVTIKDITILNAPNYAISLLGTDYVNIDGVNIFNGYCDGIDPDGCKYVRIANCQIETWDDAIVPKASFSLGVRRAVEYLTVTNCLLATNCNAFKLGTESGGGFKYITVTNISMSNVQTPIFLRLGNRGRDMGSPIPGTLRNVFISNITATGAEKPCPIVGIPGHNVEDIILDNIQITYKGGGTADQTKIQVPEHESKYPSAKMFGILPTYGFYCRHVEGIKLQDINLKLQAPDYRHALLCDDVTELILDSFDAHQSTDAEPLIRFQGVKRAMVRGCMPSSDVNEFISIPDDGIKEIKFVGNDFQRIKKSN
jgi:polygalacturonase